jgi:eukaryotic-like serine/threonine-protein kinase
MALLVGQYLGDYYLQERIDKHSEDDEAVAQVYRGEHISGKKQVAIKVVTAQLSPGAREAFLREGRLLTDPHLRHPNIVSVLKCGEANGKLFLMMDYASHGTLRQLQEAQREKRLDTATIVFFICQIASALQHLHEHNIVHRDVKPDNILLGRTNQLWLSDFGIAIDIRQSQATRLGTPLYVAPEQILGKPCPASDQYSLAVVVYEWLCGRCPFGDVDATDEQIQRMHLATPPPALGKYASTISPTIEAVVLKALAKEPEKRYPSIIDFATALKDASRSQTKVIPQPAPQEPGKRRTKNLKLPSGKTSPSPLPTSRVRTTTLGLFNKEKSLYIYRGHKSPITAIAWSPDGSYIASSSGDKSVHVSAWNTMDARNAMDWSGSLVYRLHSRTVLSVVWSPEGTRIASSDWGRTVQVWNANTGEHIFTYQIPDSSTVTFEHPLAWSPDGRFIVSASDGQPLRVWNAATGETLLTYKEHTFSVKAVAWLPDGSQIASGSVDTTVHIWDAQSGTTMHVCCHGSTVRSVAWSPDGSQIASAGADGYIRIWDASNGKNIFSYPAADNQWVRAIAWSFDGNHIASIVSGDKTVQVWDATTGEKIATYRHSGAVKALAWSPVGNYIASASGDKTVHVWQVK